MEEIFTPSGHPDDESAFPVTDGLFFFQHGCGGFFDDPQSCPFFFIFFVFPLLSMNAPSPPLYDRVRPRARFSAFSTLFFCPQEETSFSLPIGPPDRGTIYPPPDVLFLVLLFREVLFPFSGDVGYHPMSMLVANARVSCCSFVAGLVFFWACRGIPFLIPRLLSIFFFVTNTFFPPLEHETFSGHNLFLTRPPLLPIPEARAFPSSKT